MYVLSENTKLFRTFDGPVIHKDTFSIRVRAYSETQTWFVEATNGWRLSQQGNVISFAKFNPDKEITHTLADRVWKHINEYVATIDANVVSFYVNGKFVHEGSVDEPAFDFEPWSVLQFHGGTSPKTIFDVLQLEHTTVWTASNVENMYKYAIADVDTRTDDRLIQFVNTPPGSVIHDMFDGNIDTGRFSVRVKTDKDTSFWTLTASDSWVFRYEFNTLTFEEPETQSTRQVDLTAHVSQSVSNVSDYLVNVERRNVHFFFNGQKVGTQSRAPNTFLWSHATIESEEGPIHLAEILVNEAWSNEYIAHVFTA